MGESLIFFSWTRYYFPIRYLFSCISFLHSILDTVFCNSHLLSFILTRTSQPSLYLATFFYVFPTLVPHIFSLSLITHYLLLVTVFATCNLLFILYFSPTGRLVDRQTGRLPALAPCNSQLLIFQNVSLELNLIIAVFIIILISNHKLICST